MSHRPTPRQQVARMFLWSTVAIAGLWPFWPGLVESRGHPFTMVDMVRASDGWLGFVAIGGLLGVLVGLLHGLKALDLWLDLRALRRGKTPGEGRAIRLGLAVATSLAALAVCVWTDTYSMRRDLHGNARVLIEGYESRSGEAWARLLTAWKADRPANGTAVPRPGADPLPTLKALDRSPLARRAFYLAPSGVLTVYNRDFFEERVYVRDLRSWQVRMPVPRRFLPGPYSRGYVRPVDPDWLRHFVEDLRTATFDFDARLYLDHNAFMAPWSAPRRSPIYLKGDVQHGWLGWQVDPTWLGRRRDILHELGIPGEWALEVHNDPYLFPAPKEHGLYELRTIRLAVDSELDEATVDAHTQAALMKLAAFALLFLAATIEAVRQFRLLIAERAMRMAQSSFVSGVSHEMRTPLATMKLYGELLEQKLDTEPGQREEFVGAILTEVERLHRLVENVLDFARISGKKRIYAFVPTALHGALEEAIASARGPLQAAGMEAELHCPAPLTAAVDRDALVQAVANLVTNAAKYAADGKRVWVTAVPREGGVTIEVQDFGAGIPREEQARIFQPFYRVAGTAAGGTGLGLALVREYVTAHGGWLELESRPGQGATFRLHLPEDPARPLAPRAARVVNA